MKIRDEETAQGSAELILLFGGIIIIALVAAIYYRNYLAGLGGNMSSELDKTTGKISDLKNKFT